jgi:hypothetical protein
MIGVIVRVLVGRVPRVVVVIAAVVMVVAPAIIRWRRCGRLVVDAVVVVRVRVWLVPRVIVVMAWVVMVVAPAIIGRRRCGRLVLRAFVVVLRRRRIAVVRLAAALLVEIGDLVGGVVGQARAALVHGLFVTLFDGLPASQPAHRGRRVVPAG